MTARPLVATRRTFTSSCCSTVPVDLWTGHLQIVVEQRTLATIPLLNRLALPLHNARVNDRFDRSGGVYANVGNGDHGTRDDGGAAVRAGARTERRLAGLPGVRHGA